MQMRRVLLAMLLVAAVVSCGDNSVNPSARPSPTPGVSFPRPTRTAEPTAGPPTPFRSISPLRLGIPDEPFHDVPDFERAIPTALAGITLTVESVRGTGFTGYRPHNTGLRCRWYDVRGLRCRDQAQLTAVLSALGATREDVVIAVGYDPPNTSVAEIQATRVDGRAGALVHDAVLNVLREHETTRGRTLDVSTATIAGKTVTVISNPLPYPAGRKRYFYATADVLYDIRKASLQTVEEFLAQLP